MLKNIQSNYFKKQCIHFSQVLNENFLDVRSGTPKPALLLQKRGLQCGWSESYSLTEMSSRQIGGSKIILSFSSYLMPQFTVSKFHITATQQMSILKHIFNLVVLLDTQKSSPLGLVLEFEIWRLKAIIDLISW